MSRDLVQQFRSPIVDDAGRVTVEWQHQFKNAVVLDAHGPNSINDPRFTLPAYASNAAALAGGLVVNQLYRNGDNVCVVH